MSRMRKKVVQLTNITEIFFGRQREKNEMLQWQILSLHKYIFMARRMVPLFISKETKVYKNEIIGLRLKTYKVN